jgi:integrase
MLMMYRHGLRVSEALRLRRDDVNLDQAWLWVERAKNGLSVEHPIPGDELRAIERYFSSRTDRLPWLFISERGTFRRGRSLSDRQNEGRCGSRAVRPETSRLNLHYRSSGRTLCSAPHSATAARTRGLNGRSGFPRGPLGRSHRGCGCCLRIREHSARKPFPHGAGSAIARAQN